MFSFLVTDDFEKDLKKLDANKAERVKEKLRFIRVQENPLFYAKKLQGYKDIFRFRVGDFRLIFRLQKNTLIFLKVSHRKDIYEAF